MPETVTLVASGKAVVSGEYAVLWGGAAIAVPVAQAQLRLTPAADAQQFSLRLEPFSSQLRGSRSQGSLATVAPDDAVAQGFAQLWQTALELWGRPAHLDNCDYVVDTSALYRPDGTKWGWGSSGAAKALLVRLWTGTGPSDLATEHARVRMLEQRLGSAGSGIDSAVSLASAPLHYTMQGFRAVAPRGEQGYWIALPQSVKTEVRVSTVLQAVDAAQRRLLLDGARHCATAYHTATTGQWLGSLRDYDQRLETVLEPLGLARFDEYVNEIQNTLGALWYVRPSGAGGDGVLALPTGSEARLPPLAQAHVPILI